VLLIIPLSEAYDNRINNFRRRGKCCNSSYLVFATLYVILAIAIGLAIAFLITAIIIIPAYFG